MQCCRHQRGRWMGRLRNWHAAGLIGIAPVAKKAACCHGGSVRKIESRVRCSGDGEGSVMCLRYGFTHNALGRLLGIFDNLQILHEGALSQHCYGPDRPDAHFLSRRRLPDRSCPRLRLPQYFLLLVRPPASQKSHRCSPSIQLWCNEL